MSMKIRLPGSRFSVFANPKVEDFIEGLPGKGLEALYLFSEGTVGSAAPAVAKDVSGKGNDAPLIGNSLAIKTAGGIANTSDPVNGRNGGFAFLSPVLLTDKFTIAFIARNLVPADIGVVGTYNGLYGSSGNFASSSNPVINPVANGSSGNANNATTNGGALNINVQNTGTNSAAEYGYFQVRGSQTVGWDGTSSRIGTGAATGTKNAWFACAASFNKDAGIEARAFGTGAAKLTAGTAADAALFITAQKALAAKHMFGGYNYNGSTGVASEIAAAVIYKDVAKTAAEMDLLLAAMKARLTPRLGSGMIL